MRTVSAAINVVLDPHAAISLWTDVRRWPSFVEGFGHVVEVSPEWPAAGAKLVWESTPGGRGRVTEKSLQSEADRFRTRVAEEALYGEQTVSAAAGPDGARVTLELSYELQRGGPLRALSDLLFIRRALRDAAARTLRRFAVEAEEEAGLR